jgi:hypothetical protein
LDDHSTQRQAWHLVIFEFGVRRTWYEFLKVERLEPGEIVQAFPLDEVVLLNSTAKPPVPFSYRFEFCSRSGDLGDILSFAL